MLSLGYARHAEPAAADWAYLAFAWAGHFGLIFLVLAALFRLAGRAIPSPRWRFGAAVAALSLLQMGLYLDMKIFQLYRYHINAWVLNVIVAGLGDSVQLGARTTATYVAVAAGVVGAQLLAVGVARRLRWRRPPVRAVVLVLAGLAAAEKAVYAWRDLAGDRAQVRFTRLLPLYQPVTVKRFAARVLKRTVAGEEATLNPSAGRTRTLLAYPSPDEVPCGPPPVRPPNVLVVVVESWRSDMLSPAVTPRLWEFRRGCVDFRDHFSGGNATRFGLFSLLYGIPGAYWNAFLAEERGPFAIARLKRLGYRFRVVSSTRLTYPEFRRTAFVGIRDDVRDELPGAGAVDRDARHPAEVFALADEARRAGRPFFAFLFLDAPHAPYHYPPAEAPFQPTLTDVNFLRLEGVVTEPALVRNRYKNAVRYDDRIIGAILDGLAARGQLDGTAVFVTGDHGEEFKESGYWGHTSAFTLQQIKTPMLARIPGVPPGVVTRRTSHMDLPATLMALTGCRAPASSYSAGRSLLDPAERPYVTVSGFNTAAVVTGDAIVVLPTTGFYLADIEERDFAYRLRSEGRQAARRHGRALSALLRDSSRFLK